MSLQFIFIVQHISIEIFISHHLPAPKFFLNALPAPVTSHIKCEEKYKICAYKLNVNEVIKNFCQHMRLPYRHYSATILFIRCEKFCFLKTILIPNHKILNNELTNLFKCCNKYLYYRYAYEITSLNGNLNQKQKPQV